MDRLEPLPEDPITNAMSVDVEDYFHGNVFDGTVRWTAWDRMESRVCANTDRLCDIFEQYSVRGTFFVLGWVGERFPHLVRAIVARGHEVASHGYAHRLIYDQTPAAFREDVRRAKQLLEDATGSPVNGFRAPSYSVTPRSLWALDILIEEGHQYDASIFPIHHDRYGIPRSPRHAYLVERKNGALMEVPASTVRVGPMNLPIGGGGYFRIFPYVWNRWGIARLNRIERQPAVFYIHPWEIDPAQPRLRARWLGRFRHYRNLHKTEARLRRLLQDFRFEPLRNLVTDRVALTGCGDMATAGLPYLW